MLKQQSSEIHLPCVIILFLHQNLAKKNPLLTTRNNLTPIGMDDKKRKISKDYAKFLDQIKQRLSNDCTKLKRRD